MIDNIIINGLVEGLTEKSIGIDPSEDTIRITKEQAEQHDWFLPRILVAAGIFATTSEAKRIHDQRKSNIKITDPLSRNLWRTIDRPEMTHFKIGKKVFWLVVGSVDSSC